MFDLPRMVKVMMLLLTEALVCQLNEDNLMHEVCIYKGIIFVLFLSLILEMLHGEKDMGKVIDYISQAPDGFFLYLTHSYSRHDTQHSYYNLKFVFFYV